MKTRDKKVSSMHLGLIISKGGEIKEISQDPKCRINISKDEAVNDELPSTLEGNAKTKKNEITRRQHKRHQPDGEDNRYGNNDNDISYISGNSSNFERDDAKDNIPHLDQNGDVVYTIIEAKTNINYLKLATILIPTLILLLKYLANAVSEPISVHSTIMHSRMMDTEPSLTSVFRESLQNANATDIIMEMILALFKAIFDLPFDVLSNIDVGSILNALPMERSSIIDEGTRIENLINSLILRMKSQQTNIRTIEEINEFIVETGIISDISTVALEHTEEAIAESQDRNVRIRIAIAESVAEAENLQAPDNVNEGVVQVHSTIEITCHVNNIDYSFVVEF